MSNEFFKKMVTKFGDKDTSFASDIPDSVVANSFIDTGSFSLNAILAASLYGGVSSRLVTCFAGIESVGKTFFVLGIVRAFLAANPQSGAIFYDSEGGVTKELFKARGIDPSQIVIVRKFTIQDFRTHALMVLTEYAKVDRKKRPPMMMVLDSLGMLATSKEMEDAKKGSEKKDMTRQQVIRSAFRTLTGIAAQEDVPIVLTNHVYQVIGSFIPMTEMSGGGGVKYAASQILYLSKRQDKEEGKAVSGSIIKVKMVKSRISREKTQVETRIRYDGGLDRYYGLLTMGVDAGLFEQIGAKETARFKPLFGPEAEREAAEIAAKKKKDKVNDKSYFITANEIYKEPLKYFTPDVMSMLELYVKKHFNYGLNTEEETELISVDEDE